jgi:hypothetical protein
VAHGRHETRVGGRRVRRKTLRRRRSAREDPPDDENSESPGNLEAEDPKVRGKPRTEGEKASHKPSRSTGPKTLKHAKTARAKKSGLATRLVSFLYRSGLVGRTFTACYLSVNPVIINPSKAMPYSEVQYLPGQFSIGSDKTLNAPATQKLFNIKVSYLVTFFGRT